MTALPDRLTLLGDALEAAARQDLEATRRPAATPIAGRRRLGSKRLGLVLVAAAVAVPGAALAARHFLSPSDVAASMPAGTLALAGTEPTCTVVVKDVEFHCSLAKPPSHEVADWKGTVEPTVDASKHINGGCRSLASDGRTWQCYIGQAAVRQQIIGSTLLGQASAGPGAG